MAELSALIVALCRLRASRVRFPSRRLPTRPLVMRVVQNSREVPIDWL